MKLIGGYADIRDTPIDIDKRYDMLDIEATPWSQLTPRAFLFPPDY